MIKILARGKQRRFMCLSEITFVKSFVKLHNRIRPCLTHCRAQLVAAAENSKKAGCRRVWVNIKKSFQCNFSGDLRASCFLVYHVSCLKSCSVFLDITSAALPPPPFFFLTDTLAFVDLVCKSGCTRRKMPRQSKPNGRRRENSICSDFNGGMKRTQPAN